MLFKYLYLSTWDEGFEERNSYFNTLLCINCSRWACEDVCQEVESFVCWHCEKFCDGGPSPGRFTEKFQLEVHIRIDHREEVLGSDAIDQASASDVYACKLCANALYTRAQDIVKHMRYTHQKVSIRVQDYVIRSSDELYLPCEVCGKESLFSKFCRAHRNNDKNVAKCKSCTVCGERFVSRKRLDAHSFEAHPDLCDDERHSLRDNFLKNKAMRSKHAVMDEASGMLKFKCFECGKLFSHLHSLKNHTSGAHSNEKKFVCDVCSEGERCVKFSSLKNLSAHRRRMHAACVEVNESVLLTISSEMESDDGWRYDVPFTKQITRVLVDEAATRYKCPECESVFTKFDSLKQHWQSHGGEPNKRFACVKCARRFFTKRSLFAHYLFRHRLKVVRTGDNGEGSCENSRAELRRATKVHVDAATPPVYKCPQCPSMFRRFLNLQHHLRKHKSLSDGNNAAYVCETCGKTYASVSGLQSHVNWTHRGVRYACTFCDKAFTVRSNLKAHVRAHVGERNHVCEVCGKRFTNASLLKHHTHVHQDASFECDTCTAKFKFPEGLRAHTRQAHAPPKFGCELCGAMFRARDALRNHCSALHSDERSHVCDLCDARFKLKKYLSQHMKTHLSKHK